MPLLTPDELAAFSWFTFGTVCWSIYHTYRVFSSMWYKKTTGYDFRSGVGRFQMFLFWPTNAYWGYLIALYFISLVVLFQFSQLIAWLETPSLATFTFAVAVCLFASFAFLIPLIAAVVTARIVHETVAALSPHGSMVALIGTFILYALIQVTLVGSATGNERVTQRLLSLTRNAIPIASLIVSVGRFIHDLMN